jgi:hypothetical protein
METHQRYRSPVVRVISIVKKSPKDRKRTKRDASPCKQGDDEIGRVGVSTLSIIVIAAGERALHG